MRTKDQSYDAPGSSAGESSAPGDTSAPTAAVPANEKLFFESFYRANVRGEPRDRMTIGVISDLESRFHYNVTENSIIRALVRREPPPSAGKAEMWRLIQQRRGLRSLDIGSGTGHWIDFFHEVLLVNQLVGVEITAKMSDFLRSKYAGQPNVQILHADVVDDSFTRELIGGPVDYISAIGVMFHITDDDRWRAAMKNLASVLKPDGLMFIGGDFGTETRNVQFHRRDEFKNWREFNLPGQEEVLRVNKRVRSLAEWHRLASTCGLEVVDLVRSDREPGITTPENDLLVLRMPA